MMYDSDTIQQRIVLKSDSPSAKMLSWESTKMNNCFLCSRAGSRPMGDKVVCEDCHWRGAAEVVCECCGSAAITHQIVLDGLNTWVCADCPKRPLLMCNDCGDEPATRQFCNMCDDMVYDLCEGCYSMADHHVDYASTLSALPRPNELNEWLLSMPPAYELVEPEFLSNPVVNEAWRTFASQAAVRTLFDEDYERVKRNYERTALLGSPTYAEWQVAYRAVQLNFAVADLNHAIRESKIDYARNPETLESNKTVVSFHLKLCARKYHTYSTMCDEIQRASKKVGRVVIKNWLSRSTCHCGAIASHVFVADNGKNIRVCRPCLGALVDAAE